MRKAPPLKVQDQHQHTQQTQQQTTQEKCSWHIQLYSGTGPVKEWDSEDTPDGDGKGMNFVDKATGKSVYISGTLICTVN